MSETNRPTLAFFGATGGCTVAALHKTLSAGYHVSALARTPSKLHDLLIERGLSDAVLKEQLTVHEGNVKDVPAVKKTLVLDGDLVDLVVSGIGGALQPGLRSTLDDPNICGDAARTILTALREIRAEQGSSAKRPAVLAISTTGISDKKRDIPLAMIPLYHWMLSVPHADKKVQEQIYQEEMQRGADSNIKGLVLVRPSLLVNGHETGTSKLRVGWEGDGADGADHVTMGYAITRESVGSWIFEDFVDDAERRQVWMERRIVTLTE